MSQEQFEERLRSIVDTATESPESANVDWETHPLPQEVIRRERAQSLLDDDLI
jgi:hypothetical protein